MKNFDWLFKTPIAHRGLHNEVIPENTISAFQNAKTHGFLIETDVRFTKDKRLVLFHDDTLLRTCKDERKIIDLTFDEINEIFVKTHGENLPTLEDLLKIADNQIGLLIELKSDGSGELEKAVNDCLSSYSGPYAIQSFHPLSVKWFTKNAPNVTRGLLVTNTFPKEIGFVKKFILKNLVLYRSVKPNFIACDENYLNNKRIQNKAVRKLAWTIRNPMSSKRILDDNLADNVIFENYIP